MNVLITGHSSGIGAGLTKVLLANGNDVLGLSRSRWTETHPNLYQETVDLQNESEVISALSNLVHKKLKKPNLIFLNAGVLGPIASLQNTKNEELQYVMQINVWINKVILDWFLEHNLSPEQIITISSGAAIRGNFGWSSYALSKSTLNMLTQLYAHEFKKSHLLALAPGYVDTKMQSVLRTKNSSDFPSLEALHQAHGTSRMPSPETLAHKIIENLAKFKKLKSGSYFDLRTIKS